ncbi:family 61 glycoside hydrolase [Cryphonectria parasitica EP155]|uniref:lytic cellulose monooxygenase (C4-dehydrogenating) n=1 Tax=Cryphonectria parasitica (strain ATCC 38755 / EP155) TaxID=660469 RepID=A0A9P4XYN0_CRYP1|nr:family 61 glycoside hydrolase [Cryphonectria parasitica EP155]KAF3762945.1 family 61 glycoside hydrolase [Cryphonectria parasitica EP155]
MRFSLLATVALGAGAAVEGHTIFQKVSVNDQDQAELVGLRAPDNNNPVLDVTSDSLICGTAGTTSTTVISAEPGDKIGAWWQHIIGGPQGANDADNPIASSHKGPVMAYMARVVNAATSPQTGLQWFKISSDGFDTSTKTWGVDDMIANDGWSYHTLPSCLAPGQYLLRAEIIALHSAYAQGQAQFYSSCAQLEVGGSGSTNFSSTVSFPGAYTATDPSILINIYGPTGQPDNGGKPYTPPGPAVVTC